MTHKPRKRFGQNFLIDKNVIARIIDVIAPKHDENILEIGPGLGALTMPLLKSCKKLNAIELDRDVIPLLKASAKEVGELILHEGDALKFTFEALFSEQKPIRCVGNLPYNISSPLIFHLLEQRHWVKDMHFMLQKEMVDRIVAKPGNKAYGRISVMVQYFCQVEKLFLVSPTSFNPPPKVDSAIIYLKPYQALPFVAKDETKFALIIRDAFNQRRKTIANSLKKHINTEQLTKLDINPKARPEELSVETFVKLSNET